MHENKLLQIKVKAKNAFFSKPLLSAFVSVNMVETVIKQQQQQKTQLGE